MERYAVEERNIKRFIENHPARRVSAARITYTLYVQPEVEAAASRLAEVQTEMTEQDLEYKQIIEQTEDANALVKLMRKHLCAVNRDALRIRLLKHEQEVLPLIKEKAMTTMQDDFIENAIYVLLRCRENCSAWILEQYEEFRSEYLKSLLCLVLGFKGEKELISFMMRETDRYVREYPGEYFEQGPVLAVQELYVRFYRN